MKIFGSISELVDLAFRLAGGKQVKLLSRTQNTSGDTIQAYIPDVSTTGDTQEIVLTKAIQNVFDKTLKSTDTNLAAFSIALKTATISNAVDITAKQATFGDTGTAVIGTNGGITVNSAESSFFHINLPQDATEDGLLQTDGTGSVSSAKLLDKNIDADADISFSKLAPLSPANILVGSGSSVATAVPISGDVTLSSSGDVQIVAGAVGDDELADGISASKIESDVVSRPIISDVNGNLKSNGSLSEDDNYGLYWDKDSKEFASITTTKTQLEYLNTVTSNVQDQLDGKVGSEGLTTDDIAEGSTNLYFTDAKAKNAAVDDVITDGVTDVAPSQNAVFDALALKANSADLGTIASQDASSVNITGGSLSGVELDVLDQQVEAVTIATNSLSISKGVVNVSGTGPINTLSSSFASGSLVFLRNASGADLVVSNGLGNILTGTGADFDLLDGAVAPFLYDGTNWNLAGGAGAGGGAGSSIEVTQANHGFEVRQALYKDISGTYKKAIASASDTAEVVGIVSEVIDTNTFVLSTSGYVTVYEAGVTPALSIGKVYFLSDSVAGEITEVEPSTIGSVSKPVLIADTFDKGFFVNYRGVVVGAANARTQISLNNAASTNVQNFSEYDAAKLDGYVYINGTTDYRFYVEAQVSKNGAGDDYNLSYQTSGDTPPSGFDMAISSSGMLSLTLPSITGFVAANINYALNAPAVGTSFPLSVQGSSVTEATSSEVGVVKKNKTQKFLQTTDLAAVGTIPGLSGGNLTIGKRYRISASLNVNFSSLSGVVALESKNGSSVVQRIVVAGTSTGGQAYTVCLDEEFVAADTSFQIYCQFRSGGNIDANNSGQLGFMRITELNNVEITTDFT